MHLASVQQVLLWVWVSAVRYALYMYMSCFVISKHNIVTSRLATIKQSIVISILFKQCS